VGESPVEPDPVPEHVARPAFRKLWTGHMFNAFGFATVSVAVPLFAIQKLNATSLDMGLLRGAEWGGPLLFGLISGVVVDRLSRRSILLMCLFLQPLVLGALVLLGRFGSVTIHHLLVAMFLFGVTAIFEVNAMAAWLPSLVGRSRLAKANSSLQIIDGFVLRAAMALGGWLVDRVTALWTIAIGAGLIFGAWSTISTIPRSPPAPAPDQRRSWWHDVAEGVRALLRHPVVGPMAICFAIVSVSTNMFFALSILFMTRIGLSASWIGLAMATLGVGSLVGTWIAPRFGDRIPLGPGLIAVCLVFAGTRLLVPAAGGSFARSIALLGVGLFFSGAALSVVTIHQRTVRQFLTEPSLLGRVEAAARFLFTVGSAAGGLAGGIIGELIGLRPGLALAALLGVVAAVWLAFSPARALRRLA
jgi:predicted MFS family arabinose efflux permease